MLRATSRFHRVARIPPPRNRTRSCRLRHQRTIQSARSHPHRMGYPPSPTKLPMRIRTGNAATPISISLFPIASVPISLDADTESVIELCPGISHLLIHLVNLINKQEPSTPISNPADVPTLSVLRAEFARESLSLKSLEARQRDLSSTVRTSKKRAASLLDQISRLSASGSTSSAGQRQSGSRGAGESLIVKGSGEPGQRFWPKD